MLPILLVGVAVMILKIVLLMRFRSPAPQNHISLKK